MCVCRVWCARVRVCVILAHRAVRDKTPEAELLEAEELDVAADRLPWAN